MYECENNDKPQTDSQLNPYECAISNDFELYNIHSDNAEIEKWSIVNTKIDYVEYNRNEVPSNRVKFRPTEGKCQKGYRQLKSEIQPYQESNFDSMTEELQADYLDRYEGVQVQICQVSQFDDSSAVSTTYFSKTDRTRKDAIEVQEQFSNTNQSTTVGYFTRW